jgi:hypothetical protein
VTWLKDELKVREYINSGKACAGDLILGFYVRCKRNGCEVPEPIENFVTDALSEVVKQVQQGLLPDYNEIFRLEFRKGRKARSVSVKLKEMVKVGLLVDDYIEAGSTFEDATEKVATLLGISTAKICKIFTAYNKWEE